MKTVYLTLMLHGNMCYDRYTKHTIREQFPRLYRTAVTALRGYPEVTAHIDLPGITIKSLQMVAPDLVSDLQDLARRGQVVFVGCQYAASHAICCDAETDVQAGRLTMDIIRRELGFEPTGFFPQEIVHHPQTPWVMKQIGARWVIVGERDWRRPRRLVGLDGTEVIGIPLNYAHLPHSALEQTFDACEDGDLLVTGGDFEMLADVDALVAQVERLRSRGKNVEFTTFDAYLAQHPPLERVRIESCSGYQPEDAPTSPTFSRWTADPSDIEVHSHARPTMEALRAAGILAATAQALWGVEADETTESAAVAAPDNPWAADFEGVEDFPEVGPRYLSAEGKPTLFSEAWHYLLVGVNSDAAGWYPHRGRRRHRIASLDTAAVLAAAVSRNALAALATRLAPVTDLPDANRWLLVCNPGPAKEITLAVPAVAPTEAVTAGEGMLASETRVEEGRLVTRARIPVGPFGYSLVGLRPAGASNVAAWEPGTHVKNGDVTLALRNGQIAIGKGAVTAGLLLAPFRLTNPISGQSQQVIPDRSRMATRTCDGLCPRLEICGELAWGVETRLVLEAWPEEVICEWEFRFDLPRQVGEGAWSPRGLVAILKCTPGSAYYDVPCGMIRHPNQEASYFAAARFGALCGQGTTTATFPLSGEQCLFVNPTGGQLGLCMGASTEGAPGERPHCTIDERGYAEHHMPAIGDIFCGSYNHRFAIRLGEGDWKDLGLPAAAWAHSQQPVVYETRPSEWKGNLPATGSLLDLAPRNVKVLAARISQGRPSLLLNEMHGVSTKATLRVGDKVREVSLPPFGVAGVEL